jgi:hypothetical protein
VKVGVVVAVAIAVAVDEGVAEGVRVGAVVAVAVGDKGSGTAVAVSVSVNSTDSGTAVGKPGAAVQAAPTQLNKIITRCLMRIAPLSGAHQKDASFHPSGLGIITRRKLLVKR